MRSYKYCYWNKDADWSLAHWAMNKGHQFQIAKLCFGWMGK